MIFLYINCERYHRRLIISVSKHVIERLCYVYGLLKEINRSSKEYITSKEIENKLNINSHTVRKDINNIGEIGPSPAGYPVNDLKELIGNKLGLGVSKNICIVGIGKLGMAILNYMEDTDNEFNIVAGFESNTNKIELSDAKIPLYPTYRIVEIIKELEIEIGLIAISSSEAGDIINRLIEGGIKGIINFSSKAVEPDLVKTNNNVWIRNINIENEFRKLTAVIRLNM